MDVALSFSVGAAVDVPDRGTVCVVAEAEDEMLKAALSEPAIVGLKETSTVQLADLVRVVPHALRSTNELAFVPLIEMLFIVTVAVSLFFNVTAWASLVEPTAVESNARLVGLSARPPVVTDVPVPASLTI